MRIHVLTSSTQDVLGVCQIQSEPRSSHPLKSFSNTDRSFDSRRVVHHLLEVDHCLLTHDQKPLLGPVEIGHQR
jgi:hypothetical protein